MEAQRSMAERQHYDQMNNLKNHHINEKRMLESEIDKLKNLHDL